MDTDAASSKTAYEKMITSFSNGEYDILVGTQMVAKGLDFPNVTLVGVLNTDQALYADDYRSYERAFSLLTQVVGRSGRGSQKGMAVIQTYTPDNMIIGMAAKQDYNAFYEMELALRRAQGYPPFGDLVSITFIGQEEARVIRGAAKFRDSLLELGKQPQYAKENYTVLGPAPCAVPKINYNFRYQLTLRCRMTRNLRLLLAHLLREFSKDKVNRGVSAFVDVNGYD